MNIHHTHTRKTLVDLISIYKLDSQACLVGYKKPVISHKVKRNMILKEQAIKDLNPHFSIKRGSFTLKFS